MKIPNYFLIVGITAFLCLTYLPNALAVEQAPDLILSNKNVAESNVVDINLAGFVAITLRIFRTCPKQIKGQNDLNWSTQQH